MPTRTCTECLKEFSDTREIPTSPFEELGDIFVEKSSRGQMDLCPDCREKYGMMFLMGVDQ